MAKINLKPEYGSLQLFETGVLRKINHPNVVRTVDQFKGKDGPISILELCAYGSLQNQLFALLNKKETKAFPEKIVVKVMRDLSGGLQECHSKNVVHLDMKNDNVIIDAQMNSKICDFGIAKLLDDGKDGMETKDKIMGTPGWIAPESKKGILGTKADIWGLGTVLYSICTIVQKKNKSKPFDMDAKVKDKLNYAGKEINFTADYTQEDFPIDHAYSDKLKNLIASMLHRDWTKRPSSENILKLTEDWDFCKGGFKQGSEHFAFLKDFKEVDIKTSKTC